MFNKMSINNNNNERLQREIANRREYVQNSWKTAISKNKTRYDEGDSMATEEYCYQNQKEDAHKVINHLYEDRCRVVSIQKKTKVGADGLMLEILHRICSHIDDDFIVHYKNIRIITGMSNTAWEENIKNNAPDCFRDNIFHHGKLTKSDLTNLRDSLIIIDEIDSGDKEGQRLHTTLADAKLLDVNSMNENNNRFIFISATMIKELYDLYQWGDLHKNIKMTIPESYIGHSYFLENDIIQEFYPLNTRENAEKWINEDIISKYDDDFRVHIVRVKPKTLGFIVNACIRFGIDYRNHTSKDRLTEDDERNIFINPIQKHCVILIKGLFRRANLIPNSWKLRIGAVHEFYTVKPDNNVQIQGLPGRMCGYWKDILESGHMTGPYRTSIRSIIEYEEIYDNPFGENNYSSFGFSKKSGWIKKKGKDTMLTARHVNIENPLSYPNIIPKGSRPILKFNIGSNIECKTSNIFDIVTDHCEDEAIKQQVNQYRDHLGFTTHCCWNMDTPNKCRKWGLSAMQEEGAYSSSVNIHQNKRHTNIIMFYVYNNNESVKTIFISPWAGSE